MNVVASCPFCLPELEMVEESQFAFVIRDSYAVSPNHTLVIPKRHVISIFELETIEQADIWEVVAEVRNELVTLGANAVNVGINDGIAAGQTVEHAHVHIIPRYDGDVKDPRGGVRWVIPAKAVDWE